MENNTANTTTDAQNDPANKGKKGKKKKKRMVILGGISVAILAIILITWASSLGHETTDNAQIDAIITPVRSIVSGFVTDIKFTDNQQVKKGDTLVVIDRNDYIAKLAQAEASLESAKAQLELSKAGETTASLNANASVLTSQAAKENIASAQARLNKDEKDIARIEKMLKDGATTQQQYESAKAEYETARAQYEMLKKQYEASSAQATGAQSQAEGQKSQIALSTALVKQREAELVLAKTQLDNTIIVAPFDGIISKKSVEVGQYMQIGAPLCSAVDFRHLYVTANFKETQIEEMKPGQEVDLKVDAFPKAHIKGKLESFGGATGAKFSLLPPDNSSGNFVKITQRVPVKITITEFPQEMTGLIIPGLSVVVDVKTK
ncbi:MAG: HlyD family secretion protein [Bacteroidota bacterium]